MATTPATLRHAASVYAATRRLAATLTAVTAAGPARAATPDRLLYAISGAALLALAAAGALTLARATHRTAA